ncbi:MAG TPA: hypothetical protein VGY54_14275, partial [Polyangiaceae bacterium]|nr:hypothetical protein [Polyangiaceae bacterium]
SRSVLALALVLSIPLPCPRPCWGQNSADEVSTAAARSRFNEGVRFYDRGEYELARAAFLQAYALKRHPAVLINLALSCIKSAHALEAYRDFKQFLADATDITDKQRVDVNRGVAQALTQLGQIGVVATAGDEIMVDATHVGTAPLVEPIAVEPGAHIVTVKSPNGEVNTQSVSVLAGHEVVAAVSGVASRPEPLTGDRSSAIQAEAPVLTAPPGAAVPSLPRSVSSPGRPLPAIDDRPPNGETRSTGGLFPANMAPFYVSLAVAAAGGGLAVGMQLEKLSAQHAASDAKEFFQTHQSTATRSQLAAAQAAVAKDTDAVNGDATASNVALVVGGAALITSVVYWALARRSVVYSGALPMLLAPVGGASSGGLRLGVQF